MTYTHKHTAGTIFRDKLNDYYVIILPRDKVYNKESLTDDMYYVALYYNYGLITTDLHRAQYYDDNETGYIINLGNSKLGKVLYL